MAQSKPIRIKNAAFIEADWINENPVLLKGEVGFTIDNDGKIINLKVGNGTDTWSNLEYLIESTYISTDLVTNPLGSNLSGDISGTKIRSILNSILSPYQRAIPSNPTNNANNFYLKEQVLEIGQSISSLNVQFDLDNESSLEGTNPINIVTQQGGIFSNEGDFAYDGNPITLTLGSPLQPNTISNYFIDIRVTDAEGQSDPVTTSLSFKPKIVWGVSNNANLSAVDFPNISNRKNRITIDFEDRFVFDGSGYLYIAIPSMLSPSNLVFADTTNPIVPVPISMLDRGTLSINNGVGTYNYQIYRSEFIISSVKSAITIGKDE